MTPRRYARPPVLSCSPKSLLAPEAYPGINSTLKQLKACVRRLRIGLQSHRLELQILERLYYKGKNQHRTALFWQRIVELRRYGSRLQGMGIYGLVEKLRLSFWGDTSAHTPKALKGPWTHYPDAKTVLFVLQRCSDCCILIAKTQERLSATYHSLTLLVQTAAFLQLSLTLVAITSRLNSLLAELLPTVESCKEAFLGTLQILDPVQAQKMAAIMRQTPKFSRAHETVDIPESISSRQAETDMELTEDTGSIVPSSVVHASEKIATDIVQTEINPSLDLAPFQPAEDTLPSVAWRHAGNPEHRHAITDTNSSAAPDQSVTVVKRRPAIEARENKPVKKRKKKADEIDAIFGF